MPTFDFKCGNCGEIFEKTVAFGAKTKPACVKCGSKKTEKQLSVPGIVFKGTGFYKTDSTKASSKPPEEKKAKPAPKAESGKKD